MTKIEFENLQRRIELNRSRHAKGLNRDPNTDGDSTTNPTGEELNRESHLHHQIINWLNDNRILFFHGSTAHKTKRKEGERDFVVALPHGKTLWIECKRPGGKLSQEQFIVQQRLKTAGHLHYVIRSFRDFLETIHALCHPSLIATSTELANALPHSQNISTPS